MNRVILSLLLPFFLGGFLWVGVLVKQNELPTYKETSSLQGVSDLLSQTDKNKKETLTVDTKKKVKAPGPLTTLIDSVSPDLVLEQVFFETNKRRKDSNLPLFSLDDSLTHAAENKTEDMFIRQYFEHVSPSGVAIADLMNDVGYEYITVGENLAMGNYKNEVALLDAWIASPPHRENILNATFTQIGISVQKGIFDGREVWMAVQEFGKPLSACPSVDAELLLLIEANKTTLDTLEEKLSLQKEVIDSYSPQSGSAFSEAVTTYNALVSEFNIFSQQIKKMVEKYNTSVRAFNACADV